MSYGARGKTIFRKTVLLWAVLMALALTAGVALTGEAAPPDAGGKADASGKSDAAAGADKPAATEPGAAKKDVDEMLKYFESQGSACELPQCETAESSSAGQ